MHSDIQRLPCVRLTCMAHHLLEARLADVVGKYGLVRAWVETARCVRQRVGLRRPIMPVRTIPLDDAPMDVFRLTVSPTAAARAADELIESGELRTPGRGQVMMQNVQVCTRPDAAVDTNDGTTAPRSGSGLLHDMVLLTCIVSQPGSGELLARIMLKLGAGLPVVSRGIGTGIRDRLGLLRITIPPEKEIVRLILPAHDAEGIQRLLIEEANLDRPGGGFLYQTPIRECLLDPLLRIGRHGHAASTEQIIAALDDLKGGTAWRKRIAGLGEEPTFWAQHFRQEFQELTFCCAEGRSETLVQEALAAGAGGATIASAQSLCRDTQDGQAIETVMLCIPKSLADPVLQALFTAAERQGESSFRCEILNAHAVFSHRQRR